MRAPGLSIILLFAGCQFGSPDSNPPAADAPKVDAAPDAAPDAPPDSRVSTLRRKRITIPAASFTGSHPEFPLWLTLDDTDLMARASDSGSDIHFTRTAGTPLPHQIQSWERSTGRLRAWVRVDLVGGQDTVLEMRYGDPDRTNAPNAPLVFSNQFTAVWHLDDTLANSTVADARNQRNGTAMGGLDSDNQVAARLGGGIDFSGANNDRIQFVSPFVGTGSHTFSAWVSQRTGNGFDSIVTVGTNAQNQSRWFHSHYLNGVSAGFFGNDLPGSVADIDNQGWVLLHWTWDANMGRSRMYRNGVQIDNRNLGGNPATVGTTGHIGYAPDAWGPGGNTPCTLNGTLDEVRLATTARSLEWAAAEYANQRDMQTFYMVGSEEMLP